MVNYEFRQVSFAYPEQEENALSDISFSVKQGEFLILCGHSGCGKSTLLRHMKTCLAPHGRLSGEIRYKSCLLAQIGEQIQASEIGYIMQSPENQVVTDKVWHELAFGLESLGYDTPVIRRRVAEIAAFFGIEAWFYKKVSELSGGQKQLLSLASVMVMQPEVIILDEPTSQLDPIAASEFLALLGRINRELGTTIILTEHRLEEAFPYATRVLLMEQGKIVCDDSPEKVGSYLKENEKGMFLAMPTAMRVWAGVETNLHCPITVKEGSDFLAERDLKECPLRPLAPKMPKEISEDVLLSCEEIWFRYEKESPDILKGFSITLHKGEFLCILGGNGAGKTTALKVLAGLREHDRGSLLANGRVGYLPQNPQTLFVKHTVREDLYETLRGAKCDKKELEEQVTRAVNLCGLREKLDRHPYDLSGGEQQRLALAKILLMAPDILLLDEPTKGFDAEFKVAFAEILNQLIVQRVGIIMVSHDVCFCAEYAHNCGLFFDGGMVAMGTPKEFFARNSFYTTPANRMSGKRIPGAITVDDILESCGVERKVHKNSVEEILPLPSPKPGSADFKPSPLPVWRKLLAVSACGLALLVFFYATGITDLSGMVNASGVSTVGKQQLVLYIVLFVALLVFIFAIGRRSEPPVMKQTPKQQRSLSKRTIVASVLILFCIPLTIFAGIFYMEDRQYNLVAMLVLMECMLPFVLVFEGRKPKARELVTISVLCAMGIAGRSLFFMLPQFKPVMALTIIAGVAFGGEAGFFVGAMTMMVSNMMFSQGPWTPWQMFSMGIIGFLAGILFRKGWLRRTRGALAVFGALSAILIYGGIMNPAAAFMTSTQVLRWETIWAYYVTGLPMDLIHAFGTVIFILLAAEPMLEKMDRIKEKYGLM